MKKTGICPKCGGKHIVYFDKLNLDAATLGNLGVFRGFLKFSRFEAFMCKNCGYIELYLPEKELSKFKG